MWSIFHSVGGSCASHVLVKLGLHLLGELGGLPGHVGRVDTDRACNSSLEHKLSDICAREASSPMSCFYQPISHVFVAPSVR